MNSGSFKNLINKMFKNHRLNIYMHICINRTWLRITYNG